MCKPATGFRAAMVFKSSVTCSILRMKSSASTMEANSSTSSASTTAARTLLDSAGRRHAKASKKRPETFGEMKTETAGRLRRVGLAAIALLAVLFLAGDLRSQSAAESGTQSAKNATQGRTVSGQEEQTIVAAGDIVDCPNVAGSEATARLLDSIPGTVLAIGDLAYPDGSDDNFLCYEKTWGRHKARTRPAPGNHEYHTPGAAGYLKYFGARVGAPGHAYYSFNLGAWHIIALD